MKARLLSLIPTRESLHSNRWLRWLGPYLHHPRLWHMSRKGIALGVAVGVFFGFLIPVAQIPFSAAMAVLLRANLPVAVASTLVTNPVTFGPVYYGAYRLGKAVLLEDEPTEAELQAVLNAPAPADAPEGWRGYLQRVLHQLGQVGKPLIVGLAIVASVAGLVAYGLINAIWAWKIRRSRRQRTREAQRRQPSA